jgi:hypothetical protein
MNTMSKRKGTASLGRGFVMYLGPSLLDGAPIVVVGTIKTKNRKTGDVLQVWIMRADMAPNEAVTSGADESICGNCPRRHYHGGNCYVIPWQAPLAAFRAWQRGSYSEDMDPRELAGITVRLGAYGDPAAVPFEVWAYWTKHAANVLSYTHQARRPAFDRRLARFSQISADTLQQARRYWAQGFRTYRVLNHLEEPTEEETLCPSLDGVSCLDCGACNGQTGNYAIPAHGAHSDYQKLKMRIIQDVA